MNATHPRNLPDEILLQIFGHLDLTYLLVLAATCRHFHVISLDFLFSKFRIDPLSDEIKIEYQCSTSVTLLAGLAMSLSTTGASLEHLSCILQTESTDLTIQAAYHLSRYMSKLSCIRKLTLRYWCPRSIELEDIILGLLDAVLLKSCTILRVISVSAASASRSTSGPPSLSSMLTYAKAKILSRETTLKQSSLQECHIELMPLFFRPYYLSTLNASTQLTVLSFIFVYADHADFFSRLKLPNLCHFSLMHSKLPLAVFSKFLARHPTIVSLLFRENSMPSPQSVYEARLWFPRGILPRLQELMTSAEHIFTYFNNDRLASLPSLASIACFADYTRQDLGYLRQVSIAFRWISSCANDISLSLDFSAIHSDALAGWLDGQHTQGSIAAEHSLRCVKTLKLYNHGHCFSQNVLARLPTWLATRFPALEHVLFTPGCFSAMNEEHEFVRAVGQSCPALTTFRVGDGQTPPFGNRILSGEEWCHSYSKTNFTSVTT